MVGFYVPNMNLILFISIFNGKDSKLDVLGLMGAELCKQKGYHEQHKSKNDTS